MPLINVEIGNLTKEQKEELIRKLTGGRFRRDARSPRVLHGDDS